MRMTGTRRVERLLFLAVVGLGLWGGVLPVQAQVGLTLTGPAQAASCGQVMLTNRFTNSGSTVSGLMITNELPSASYAYVPGLSTVTLPGGVVWTNAAADPTNNIGSTNLVWDFSGVVTPSTVTNLLITEVFYHVPVGKTPKEDYEWFEIYNPTTNAVDVTGWSVLDGAPGIADPLPAFTIHPGEFVIIAGRTNVFMAENPGYSGQVFEVADGKIGSGLNNFGDGVILRDAASNWVDAVSYGSSTAAFIPSVPNVGEGWSIVRNPANNDTNGRNDWKPKASPTPGEGNVPVGIQKGGVITIVYAVELDCGASSGQIFSRAGFEQPPGTLGTKEGSTFLTVNIPDLVVTKTPIMQSAGVGDTVTWAVRVENAGFGEAANVVAVDTIGPGFSFTGFSVVPTTQTTATATWDATAIPAFTNLAAGDYVDIVVTAEVVSCAGLYNQADARWGCSNLQVLTNQVCEDTSLNNETATAGIRFIDRYPDVTVSLAPYPLLVNYCDGAELTLYVSNAAGADVGMAKNFTFIPTLPGGWSVSGASTTNGIVQIGQLLAGASTSVTVTVMAGQEGGVCPIDTIPQGIYFKPAYTDACSNSYDGPVLADLATLGDEPMASVRKIMPARVWGDDGSFPVRIELTYDNFKGSEVITLTDLFPVHTNLTVDTNSISAGGTQVSNTVVWTLTSLSGSGVATSSFDMVIGTPCGGPSGLLYNEVQASSYTDCQGCPREVIGNGYRFPLQFNYGTNCPNPGLTGGCSFVSSKDVFPTLTEVCAPVMVTHTFSGFGGTLSNWTGVTFASDLADGAGTMDNTGKVMVWIDGSDVTSYVSLTQTAPALVLDLSGLNGSSFSEVSDVTTNLVITWPVSVGNAGQYADDSSLTIPGCGTQGDTVVWNAGESQLEIELGQILIARACGRVPGSINLEMIPSPEGVPGEAALFPAYDVVVTLDMDFDNDLDAGFSYIPGTPVFSNIVDLAGTPVPAFDPAVSSNKLIWNLGDLGTNTDMSIHYLLRPSCSSDISGLRRADVAYNVCDDDTTPQKFAFSQTNAEPFFVSAPLINTLQPEVQFLTDTQIVSQIRILNTGDPAAYNLYIEMDLPPGVSFGGAGIPPTTVTPSNVIWDLHASYTNFNPAFPLYDDDLDGSFDDLRAREELSFWVTNHLDTCTGNNELVIRSSHGCKGEICSWAPESRATFETISGSLVTRATFPVESALCDTNLVLYSVRNSGLTVDYDVKVFQTLPTGMTYVPGSSGVSINGGATNTISDPTITGASSNRLAWTSGQIPELAAMQPNDDVTISYWVQLGCELVTGDRHFLAEGTFTDVCGNVVSNREVVSIMTPGVPVLKVDKASSLEVADLGEEVVYTITIRHDPESAANVPYMVLTDVLPAGITYVSASVTPDMTAGQMLTWSNATLNGLTGDGQPPFAVGDGSITLWVTGVVNSCAASVINVATVDYGCSETETCLSASNSVSIITTPILTPPALVSEMDLTTCGGTKTTTVTNSGASTTNGIILTEYAPPGYIFTSATASGHFSSTGLIFASSGTPSGSIAVVDFSTTTSSGATDAHDDNSDGPEKLELGKQTGFTVVWTLASTGENLDCLADPTDLDYDDPDPAPPSQLTSSNLLVYTDLCGETNSAVGVNTAYPGIPDLDIDLQPNSLIVTNGEVVSFSLSVINDSETTDADGIYVRVKLGTGWTNLTYVSSNIVVSAGLTAMQMEQQGDTNLLFDFPGVVLSPLNDKIEVFFTAEVTQNGGSLDAYAEVVGDCGNPAITPACTFTNTLGWAPFADTMDATGLGLTGPVNGQYYSFDQDRFVAAGHTLSKTVRYDEEVFELAGTNRNARVGEDLFYHIEASYFGGDFSAVTVTDSLPDQLGFGEPTNYVFTGDITGAVWNAVSGEFTLQPTNWSATRSTFTVDIPVVVSNRMDVQDGGIITNIATTDFTLVGVTNVPIERTTEVEIYEPVLQITKTVNSNLVQEGDIIIFTNRLVHTAASRTSAYSVVFTDTLPPGLVFDAFISPTLGNVAGQTITFNTNHLAAMGEFKTNDLPIEFVFSVLVTNQLVGATMTNTSSATYVSLDNVSTNGNERDGTDGPGLLLNNYITESPVTLSSLPLGGLTKTFVSSTQTNTLTTGGTNDWTIGERFVYEIRVDVPQGVVSNLVLTDAVPVGIDWVGGNTNADLTYPGRGYEFDIPAGGPQFPTNVGVGLTITDTDPTPDSSLTADGSGEPVVFTFGAITNAADGNFANDYFLLRLEFVALNQATNAGILPNPRRGSNVVTATDSVTTLSATGPVYRIVEHDVRAQKLRSPAIADAGDVMTFTVVVSNQPNALANAYDVRVTDILSSNVYDFSTFTFVSATPGWTNSLVGVGGGRRYELTSVGTTALPPGTGATGVFTVALAQGVRPNQIYTNQVNVTDSTTLYGLPPGGIAERNDTATTNVNFRIPGLALAKVLESTSEVNNPPDSLGADVQIGERLTYRVDITLPESTITNLTLVDTLSSNGLAYIFGSARLDTNGFEGSTGDFVESPAGTATTLSPMGQQMTFSFTNVVVTGDNDTNNNTFYMLLDYLVLDDPANIGLPGSQTVHTNFATLTYDGNPGNVVTSTVVRTTVVEPNLVITKSIDPDTADAGDVVDVTLVVSNNGTATAYDLEITDELDPSFFSISTLTNVTLPTGLVSVVVGNTFRVLSDTNAATGTNTLEVGESLEITFQIAIAQTVNPNARVTNNAIFKGDTLAGTNIYDVQRDYAVTNGATLTISNFCSTCGKVLWATSETGLADSTNDLAQIGEVLTFRISSRLPETTIPNLVITDHLPEGLAYVVGSGRVVTNEFDGTLGTLDITPTNPPLGGSGEDIVFTFTGDTTVTGDNEPTNNIIHILLDAVVLDTPFNVGLMPQTVLTNYSSITYTSNPEPPIVSSNVTVTLIEPDVEIFKTVSPDSGDAGDTVTVTLVATNSGLATAYDLDISDLLDGAIFDTNTVVAVTTPTGFTFAQTPSGSDVIVSYLSDTNSAQPTNTLEIGESLEFVFTVNLAQTVEPGAIYTNGVTLVTDTIYTTNTVGIQRSYTNEAQDTLTISNLFITKVLTGTSEIGPVDTTGSDVTIGETATYTLTVTLPEATITNLTVTDIVPTGMRYAGPGSVDTTGFGGSLPVALDVATLGGSGDDVTFTFPGLTVVTNNNVGTDNSFTLSFDLLTLDVPGNTGTVAGAQTVLPNSATVSYDGNPPVHTSGVVNVTVAEPLLGITKTMSAASNSIVVINLVVTNSGLATAFDVEIQDVLTTNWWDTDTITSVFVPPGFTFAFTNNPGNATITIATDTNYMQPTNSIEVGESLLFQFQATLIDGAPSPVTNVAEVTEHSTIDGPNPAERDEPDVEDEDELEIPSYSLTKVVTSPVGRAAAVGETVRFDIVVANTGPIGLNPVQLQDTYDTNYLTYGSAMPVPVDNVNDGTINWTNVGPIAVGGSVTVAVDFVAIASTFPSDTTNWVVATPFTTNGLPLVPKTNEVPVDIVVVGYTLDKTNTNPGPTNAAQVGDSIEFTITVVNTGEVALVTVPVVDTYDTTYLTYVSSVPASVDNTNDGTINWTNIGPLAVGASTQIVATFTAASSTTNQPETNTVVTSPTTPTNAPPVPPKTNDAPYRISSAGYTLIKTNTDPGPGTSAQVGDTITFQILVTNTGDVELVTVPVEDTYETTYLSYVSSVPASFDDNDDGTISWTDIGPLPVGASTQIVATFTAAASTLGTNHTNVVVTMPTTPPGEPPVQPKTNDAPYEVANASYTLDKVRTSPVDRAAQVGEEIVFTITIVNNGDVNLVTVPVVDTYDTNWMSYVSAEPTSDDNDNDGTIHWTDIGPLPMGSSTTIVARFTAARSTLGLSETNTVVTTPTTPTNTPPVPPKTNIAPYEVHAAGYTLTKDRTSPTNRPAIIGEAVTFLITVVNTGDVALVTVPVEDTYETLYLRYVSSVPASEDVVNDGTINWTNIGPLAVGASTQIVATFTAATDTLGTDRTNVVVTTPTTPTNAPPVSPKTNDAPYAVDTPASLGDFVWLDENWDGVQDPGEAGIANVRIELRTNGTVIATTLTDTDGRYLFTDLPPGTYTVRVDTNTLDARLAANQTFDLDDLLLIPPPRDHQTTVTLVSGDEDLRLDFGYNWNATNSLLGSLGDRIWVDANADGVQDPGEPGIPNVTVNLYTDGAGNGSYTTLVDTATTDAAGLYIFPGLEANSYVVRVETNTLPPGYVQTGDPDHFGADATANPTQAGDHQTTTPIVLAPGDVFVNADFGYLPPSFSNLGDLIYFDANADGVFNPAVGDYAIPGVTVALLNSNGLVIASTITTGDATATNNYLFTGLQAGEYTVWVNDTGNVLNGLVQTGDPDGGNDNLSTTNLNGVIDNLLQDHGYTPDGHGPLLGLIGDTIFLDRDGDGSPGVGEGIQGVTVQLLTTNGTLLATTTTDPNGLYFFGGLPAGNYVVQVATNTLPNGGVGLTNSVDPDSLPGTGDSQSFYSLGEGEINLEQDFGYIAGVPGLIGGTLWYDCNADGTLDGDENIRWEGIKLELRDAAGHLVGWTLTDATGDYVFTGLPGGTYTVHVVDVDNIMNGFWHSLGPNPDADNNSQADPYTVTLPPGGTNTTADFGYYLVLAELGDYVWYDINANGIQDGGEPGLAGVRVTLLIEYPNGTNITMETITDANGAYLFANLLLDERFRESTTNDPASDNLPRFTVSVDGTQTVLTSDGYEVTILEQGTGTNDSRDHEGTVALVEMCGRSLVSDFGYQGGPLLAVIGNVEAFTRDGETVVRWETVESWDTAGFWLDRLVDDEWRRISQTRLDYPLFGVAPIVYEEVDPGALSGATYRYRLVEQDNEGNVLFYGPYVLTVDGPGRTYADWAAEHFTADELADPAISGEDADPDGDGLSNWQEFLAGTDPQDANSVLQITSVRRTAAGIELKWKSVAGRSYKVALSARVDGPYLPLEDIVVAAGESGGVTLPVKAGEGQLYFHIILVGENTGD